MDASFVVHPDFNIPTGENMTMVEGAMQSVSRKQKPKKRITTETELVAVDDA